MARTLLIVDDSPAIVEMLHDHFSGLGYQVLSAATGAQAQAVLAGGFVGVVLLDFMLPDVEGLELLKQITALSPATRVIMITAHGTIPMAVEAVRNSGAFSVHNKIDTDFKERLSATVLLAFENLELTLKVNRFESEIGDRYSFSSIVSQSRLMQNLFRTLQHVVESKVAVLIQGESGTGKELVAKAIHYNGPRRDQPFIAINCAGIPDTLLESELFGYEKGAFTGAYGRKSGKFELANKGTLFLDEIGEMNLALQSKILRVLQEKSFERLGGTETINVDVRIISATNRNLERAVHEGHFREDLFYRLSVFPVDLPPLRERGEDIPLLATHFLDRFTREEGKTLEGFTQRTLEKLVGYHYPGNVRQLENIISHAVVVAPGPLIDIADLPRYLRGELPGAPPAAVRPSYSPPPLGLPEQVTPLDQLERLAIARAVELCQGNRAEAARRLGIGRATLYRKLRLQEAAAKEVGDD